MTIFQDYQNYFNTAQPGSSQNWAGGMLTMGNNGAATYNDPIGNTLNFSSTTPLSQLYQNPNIASLWDTTYGTNITNQLMPASTSNNFNVPTNLFSSSGSNSSSTNSSDSRSGINWNTPFMRNLTPQLNQSILGLTDTVNNMGQTLNDKYSNLMRQGLGPEAFQGTLNQLNSRGMLNGTVTSDALANASKSIMQQIAAQAYDANLAQQSAAMQLPGILGGLANLGQETTSKSAGTSSGGSYSSNPLEPYQLMAQLLTY